jgi:hypothetical protein
MELGQDVLDVLNSIPDDGEVQAGQAEEYSNNFIELARLGYLTKEVDWCGHTFTIKTLDLEEEIATGKISSQYEGSVAQYKATLTSLVAASLVVVDGTPFMPYLADEPAELFIMRRYNKVKHWFWPTVEFLAKAHNELAKEAADEMDGLQKKLSRSQRTSSDLSESLTDKEL